MDFLFQMSDEEIIHRLIARDNLVTREFFFEKCRPLFCSIISYVFDYEVDYDEFVNELYVYLMENDAQKLRNFEYRSSVYMWLKILAIRFFFKKKREMIDGNSHHPLYDEIEKMPGREKDNTAGGDLERLFEKMSTERYVYVIRKLLLEDWTPERLAKEMMITTANLYNIKRRAMAQLTRVAINDVKEYGK